MDRDKFCILLANHITEIIGKKICPTKVSEQLMLIQMGGEPTDELIGTYIKKFSNNNY